MHKCPHGSAWVAAVAVSALACGVSPELAACKQAVRLSQPGAVRSCREAYRARAGAESAGWLARALTAQGGHDEELTSLAARHGRDLGAADVLNALGAMHAARGESEAAVAACRSARDRRTHTDLDGRARDAECLYRELSARDDTTEAIAFAAEAYELARALPASPRRGEIVLGVASLFYELNDLHTFELLLSEAGDAIDRGQPSWPKLVHLRGLLALETGRRALARPALEEAIARAREAGNEHSMRVAGVSLAWLELEDGDLQAARTRLAGLASLAKDDDARAHHEYAAACIELAGGAFMKAAALSAHAQRTAPAHWLGSLRAVEGRALLRAGQLGQAEAALLDAVSAAEARRADIGLDALRSWVFSGEWREPFEDLFVLYARLGRADDALNVAERVTARSVLDGLLAEHGARDPRLALHEAARTVEGLRAVARATRSSNAAEPLLGDALRTALGRRFVLVYFRADDALWLLRVAQGEAVRLARVAELEAFERDRDAFQRSPESALAEALGDALLPAGTLPRAGETLYVVDEALGDLPLGALRVAGAPLIERHAIASVPSANVLARPVDRAGGAAPLVLGDPTDDLPAARAEAVDVARGVATVALVGAQATRSQLLASGGASLLHIASHTTATTRGPALLLADGPVSAGEILDHGVRADTVVLTACAAAEREEGEELGSLAAAFLASGSRTVVAPRWAVDDVVASQFTRAFYAADGAGDAVRAVASAQRELIRLGEPVRAWAAFAVFGGANEEEEP